MHSDGGSNAQNACTHHLGFLPCWGEQLPCTVARPRHVASCLSLPLALALAVRIIVLLCGRTAPAGLGRSSHATLLSQRALPCILLRSTAAV